MTQLAQKLDKKLATWRPEVAAQVEQIVTDVIELADTKETGSGLAIQHLSARGGPV